MRAAPAGAPPKQHRVQLVITPIGNRYLPQRLQAYHTSVTVGDKELSFGLSAGICMCRGAQSHKGLSRKAETIRLDMGTIGDVDVFQLRRILRPWFPKGSYDLFQKNCNSFSDVCLRVLTGQCLPKQYCFLEDLALTLDDHLGGLAVKLRTGKSRLLQTSDVIATTASRELNSLDFS